MSGAVRWTKEDLDRHNAKQDRLRNGVSAIVQERKQEHATANKYHAIQTISNGAKFASKGEAALYERLMMMQSAGMIAFFLRQVPFHLPGKVIYRLDFMVATWFLLRDEIAGVRLRYLDFKGGPLHPVFVLKRKQVEALYPVKIECITRKKGEFIGL